MKCLTVRQPFATAIISLGKDIENRSRRTSYRGPLLIHAARTMTSEEQSEFYAMTKDFPRQLRPLQTLPLGVIIGVVELFDCVTDSSSPWFAGPYGWKLRHPRSIAPVPWRGQLGLFDVPLEIPLHQPEYVH